MLERKLAISCALIEVRAIDHNDSVNALARHR